MELSPYPLSLRQLQYLVAIADSLSFRRAAEACHVSQPSLSAQLAELEGALGVRLFERDRRRVLVTPAGEKLLGHARRLLLEADELMGAARALADPLAGTLRIGVIPTISPYLLPAATPLLRAQHPRLQVAWVEEKTSALVERVVAGTLEAALLALEADTRDLERHPIARDAFLLAMAPGDPLARAKGPHHLAELGGRDVLLLDDGHCLRDQVLSLCGRAGAHEAGFRATSLATLLQMVASGAGITLLPQLAVAAETRHGQIVVRRFAAPPPHRTLALVWRRRSSFGAVLAPLAATLRAAYAAAAAEPERPRAVAKAR